MNDLEEIYNFVEEINKNGSRIYKEQTLMKYENNKIIKKFLYFLYNPYIKTGISRKKIEYIPEFKPLPLENIELLDMFEQIINKESINNETLTYLYSYLITIPEKYVSLVKLFFTKNIQLGMDAITINKIIPNLIPTFNIQLAEKYFEHPDYLEGKEFAITTKIDGGRIIAMKENGKVNCYTRAGQLYDGLIDIEEELSSLHFDNFVIDGEITLLNKGKLTSKEQYKETMKITRKDGEKHGVKILAFDYLPLDHFKNQKSDMLYNERRSILESHFSNLTFLNILPILYQGNDLSVITKFLDEQTSKGEEGIMLNNVNAPYKFKRNLDLLKVKKMQDIDLPIIGFEQGKNKHSNTLGSLLVSYKNNIVKVGTGLSDEIRDEIWNNKDKYLGVTISIKYFEETTNSKGGISLRFPVFIDFRFDKPMYIFDKK